MKFPSYKQVVSDSSGFTLAEVVIGISLLSVVLIAMTTLTISSIRANQANIFRLTSFYLAQEGIEGLRNVRDSNWLQNYTWNEGGSDFWGSDFSTDGYYVIDYYPFADSTDSNSAPWSLTYLGFSEADLDDSIQLYLAENSISGMQFYLHDTSSSLFNYEETVYQRYLYISYPDPDEGILEVTVTMLWQDHGRDRSLEVSSQLTNWREGPI